MHLIIYFRSKSEKYKIQERTYAKREIIKGIRFKVLVM